MSLFNSCNIGNKKNYFTNHKLNNLILLLDKVKLESCVKLKY